MVSTMQQPQKKSAFIFDPSFGPIPGHWTKYNKTLISSLEKYNYSTIVIGNKNIIPNIVSGVETFPAFTNTSYVNWVEPSDDAKSYSNMRDWADVYYNDIIKIPIKKFENLDLLICPTVTPPILMAIIALIRQSSYKFKTKIIFQFHTGIHNKSITDVENLVSRVFASIIRDNLDIIVTKDVKFYASSKEFAQILNKFFPIEVLSLPMIQGKKIRKDLDRKGESDSFSIGLFGHTSLTKGVQFVENIIKKTLQNNQSARFIYQYNPNPDFEIKNIESLRDNKRIDLIEGFISDRKLSSAINKCDIILLPYKSDDYIFMMSAMFIEAHAAGKITVVPKNTVMWSMGGFHNCSVGFEDYSSNSILGALQIAINDRKKLNKNSKYFASILGNYHNSSNYMKTLLNE